MSQNGRLRLFRVYLVVASLGLGLLFLLTNLQPVWAQERFSTQQTEILYHSPEHLREMEQRLRFPPPSHSYQSNFYAPDPAREAWSLQLADKVDGLLAQVCSILKMWPRREVRLRIILLPDSKQLRKRYLVLQPFIPTHAYFLDPEAFYEVSSRTIFLSVADLRQSILAHEMAHFVLCNTFAVPLPPAIQEDWARYVESMID